MKKRKFYLASAILKRREIVELYDKYETFGEIDYYIYVSNKKVLVYSETDENGKEVFYHYPSGKEVYERNFDSSYTTDNSYCYTFNYTDSISLVDKFAKRPFKERDYLGYFVPIHEYFGFNTEITSTGLAVALLNYANLNKSGYTLLSMNKEEAKKQIDAIKNKNTEEEQKQLKLK